MSDAKEFLENIIDRIEKKEDEKEELEQKISDLKDQIMENVMYNTGNDIANLEKNAPLVKKINILEKEIDKVNKEISILGGNSFIYKRLLKRYRKL